MCPDECGKALYGIIRKLMLISLGLLTCGGPGSRFDAASRLCDTLLNVYRSKEARGKIFEQYLGSSFGELLPSLKLTSPMGRNAYPD